MTKEEIMKARREEKVSMNTDAYISDESLKRELKVKQSH
jgi:hypothetical protein